MLGAGGSAGVDFDSAGSSFESNTLRTSVRNDAEPSFGGGAGLGIED